LYPHLIMQYNISPDTIVEGGFIHSTIDHLLEKQVDNTKAVEGNYSMAASGQLFRKDIKGFLPEMMQERYDNRVVYKKKMLEAKQKLEKTTDKMERWKLEKDISKFGNLQMAMKISLNSAYGAMGNQYFRFFDIRIAEAITLGGQLAIRWAERVVNKHLNKVLKTVNKDYVVASDTDSLYITLDALVQKIFPDQSDTTKIINFLDRVCEEDLQKVIDKAYNDLCKYMNAYEQKMFMKRENLADKGIWTGKKRYMLNVFDSEGVRYAEPKLKIMGIEAIKSSTPTACRAKLKEAFNLIMTSDEITIQKFIKDFEVEFKNSPIEDIAFPRSVKGIEKYSHPTHIYGKGTPIHVKGTLLHNHYIKQKKLTNKYQLIQEGEKIKFINLKQPNPIRNTVIAMLNGLPKEFDLDDYIDYDVQFSKSFKEPLADILKSIGWSAEKVHNLSSFFK
jgi:DNA polymerase elongation subunit (family B)